MCDDYNELETTYYYITTEKPENSAINALLDRVYGKATQPVKAYLDTEMRRRNRFLPLMELSHRSTNKQTRIVEQCFNIQHDALINVSW